MLLSLVLFLLGFAVTYFLGLVVLDRLQERRLQRHLEEIQRYFQTRWEIPEATAHQQELARQQEREHRKPNWIL
jgi:hypothetical protein